MASRWPRVGLVVGGHGLVQHPIMGIDGWGRGRSGCGGPGYRRGMSIETEVGELRRVLLRHAREAFGSRERVRAEWRGLGYLAEPDFDEACREYDAFAALLESRGVHIEWLPGDGLGLDSVYTRDAAVLSDRGALLGRMAKAARRGEPAAQREALEAGGVRVVDALEEPATLEGGDVVWLGSGTLAVGRGYRTNDAGIARLRELVPGAEVLPVPLPHWHGPEKVLHLMSIVSPLAADTMLVHSPLMPVPFRELLLDRGWSLVEVAGEEIETQGCNVLAVGPRTVVAVDGNPETRRRMEAVGLEVLVYPGREISVKGSGGPTCLTRPLERG